MHQLQKLWLGRLQGKRLRGHSSLWSVELFDFMNSGLLTLLLGPTEKREGSLTAWFVILILTSGHDIDVTVNDISWVPSSFLSNLPWISTSLLSDLSWIPSRVLSNLPWIPSRVLSNLPWISSRVLSDLPWVASSFLSDLSKYFTRVFRRRIERHNQRNTNHRAHLQKF